MPDHPTTAPPLLHDRCQLGDHSGCPGSAAEQGCECGCHPGEPDVVRPYVRPSAPVSAEGWERCERCAVLRPTLELQAGVCWWCRPAAANDPELATCGSCGMAIVWVDEDAEHPYWRHLAAIPDPPHPAHPGRVAS
jgi:hypothetical protein